MATDSTLQKIADNLLAQFDKTLLDNSTDFSSCDQILNAAPSEHKGGLESLYCDLLLDALISGYYRYDPTKDLIEKVKADDQMRLFEYSISYSEII